VELQTHRRSNCNQSADHHQNKGQLVTRVVVLSEKVWCNDIADLAEHIAQCYGDGAVLRSAAHSAGHPGGDERIRGIHSAHVNERSTISGRAVHGTKTNDVADAAKSNGTGEVIATLGSLV
jgi:hypothetical protein